MEVVRKPFQGVINIVRFNWHFYVISLVAIFIFSLAGYVLDGSLKNLMFIFAAGIIVGNLISLTASFYVYDVSHLYKLTWLKVTAGENSHIVNIHAGFDETSVLLEKKYPEAQLTVMDFYDPVKHTEVSIKRARKAYPPYPGTLTVTTNSLPIDNHSADIIFLTLAAHEIRNTEERNIFFAELIRSLKPNGYIIVTEHLRDLSNFMVYNIGFLHFAAKSSWKESFRTANLSIIEEIKITPFISSFILQKNGTTS